jgi:hypothetical protein
VRFYSKHQESRGREILGGFLLEKGGRAYSENDREPAGMRGWIVSRTCLSSSEPSGTS